MLGIIEGILGGAVDRAHLDVVERSAAGSRRSPPIRIFEPADFVDVAVLAVEVGRKSASHRAWSPASIGLVADTAQKSLPEMADCCSTWSWTSFWTAV